MRWVKWCLTVPAVRVDYAAFFTTFSARFERHLRSQIQKRITKCSGCCATSTLHLSRYQQKAGELHDGVSFGTKWESPGIKVSTVPNLRPKTCPWERTKSLSYRLGHNPETLIPKLNPILLRN